MKPRSTSLSLTWQRKLDSNKFDLNKWKTHWQMHNLLIKRQKQINWKYITIHNSYKCISLLYISCFQWSLKCSSEVLWKQLSLRYRNDCQSVKKVWLSSFVIDLVDYTHKQEEDRPRLYLFPPSDSHHWIFIAGPRHLLLYVTCVCIKTTWQWQINKQAAAALKGVLCFIWIKAKWQWKNDWQMHNLMIDVNNQNKSTGIFHRV